MQEAISQLERAGAEAHARPPTLVVLPDPEARVPVEREVLGASSIARLVASARRVGFGHVVFAPGTQSITEGAKDVATGDPHDGPALVVYESTTIRAGLLELMVAHPLEADERFTLYDELGRPAATFVGELASVPAMLPICEELPYPEGIGSADVVRIVYPEDRARAEALVIAGEDIFPQAASLWRRWIGLPTLRMMAARSGPVAQLELLALILVAASLPLAVVGAGPTVPLAALCLLLGVHTSKLIKSIRRLRRNVDRDTGDVAGERLARAARPLGHAAMTGGLTYGLVAQTDRADIAGLVLLAAGAGACVLALVQARFLLRGREAPVFALPDAHAVAARLGITLPAALEGAPLFELAVLVASLPTEAMWPWSVLVVGAAARLWRWYAGPLGAAGD
ncbi:MAG TPA: hypothetical protein VG755_42020 [Nannocystaceae bacterium]|nr:hypothetical protein [Nannocystaceae bacterium]